MPQPIVSVVIDGVTYPYVQNTNAFDYNCVCYEIDGEVKKTTIDRVEQVNYS